MAYDDGLRAFLIATPDGVRSYDAHDAWGAVSDSSYARLDTTSYVIDCSGIASCTSGYTWCGMDADGAVTCTNEADVREADGLEDAPDVAFVTFDLGDRVACGLTEDGEPLCWGEHAPRRWRP